MANLNKQKSIKSPRAAYMGYLFQTFLKRPFGYIIALLFILYLSIILLIVPASLHFEPLFIWNVGGFNMPIFNLFFIAGSAASIAVAVFRTGRDDGSDLNLSAKPFTKGTIVGLKTAVYLLIMLAICLITVAIVALVMPIFGEYNEVTNVNGITQQKYVGLLLSMLVGNIVNMLLFGGISVFISMIGGQVITIIGTIAIVFVICLMNFIYPQVLKSSIEVLSDKYDADILSYSCNTLHQYEDSDIDSKPINFATIQCSVNEMGEEEYHFDTKEYWDVAEKESGRQAANIIDIGKQLSNIYSSFGLDESKLKEASKLVIGTNSGYQYNIDAESHVGSQDNIDLGNYPISYYNMTHSQGKDFPYVTVIGGDMTLTTSNWYLLTTLWRLDFDAMNYVSSDVDSMSVPSSVWTTYTRPWNKIGDLRGIDDATAKSTYDTMVEAYESSTPSVERFVQITHDTILDQVPWFDNLEKPEQYKWVAKYHIAWAIQAQKSQAESIFNYCHEEDSFPFKSQTVKEWFRDMAEETDKEYYLQQQFNNYLFTKGIGISKKAAPAEGYEGYSRLATSKINYAETFNNMYSYTVKSYYNLYTVIAVWTSIAAVLFAGSVIVYRRTDFK